MIIVKNVKIEGNLITAEMFQDNDKAIIIVDILKKDFHYKGDNLYGVIHVFHDLLELYEKGNIPNEFNCIWM